MDGNGNSNILKHYNFTDYNPYFGINYYRLKQIDLDNKYEYSNTLYGVTNTTNSIALYPNPIKDFFIINTLAPIHHIIIYDVLGKIVYNEDYVGNKIDVSKLDKGIYFMEAYNVHSKIGAFKLIKD